MTGQPRASLTGMDSGYGPGEDFCEDDEPLENVLAAFGRGVKGKTAKPLVLVEMHGPDGLVMKVNTSATSGRSGH
jgi:hypothetical protein